MAASPADLAFIERVADGQPSFTQMAAFYLWEAKAKQPVNYDQLYETLYDQIKPHLQHLWVKLTETEQATLRRSVSREGAIKPNPRDLAGLTRRGLVCEG